MIKSFGCRETEKVFNGIRSKKWDDYLQRKAQIKLIIIHASTNESELNNPPGNKLKKLSGNLSEYYRIKINDQWRIIFKWIDGHASDVQIIDYH